MRDPRRTGRSTRARRSRPAGAVEPRPAGRPAPQWITPVPVRDWMTRKPVVVRPDAPIAEAVDLLREHRIRHLPVVDVAGRLVGIVTDRDLRQVAFDPLIREAPDTAATALAALTVRELMTWGVLSVRQDSDLRAAARLMRERKIGALPVVDDGRVVGILTEIDVLAAIDTLLGSRVTTTQPLRAAPALGRPYEYGFPVPGEREDVPNEGGGQ
jgi:CBS domain-containing protein